MIILCLFFSLIYRTFSLVSQMNFIMSYIMECISFMSHLSKKSRLPNKKKCLRDLSGRDKNHMGMTYEYGTQW